MHDRILFARALTEIRENVGHLRLAQQLRRIVGNPRHAVIKIERGDALKKFPQKRVGFRDKFRGRVAGEGRAGIRHAPRRKQAIDDGLRV